MGKAKPTRLTNRIRALRFQHGEMTQAALARAVGVTRQTIIAIEKGKYSPSLEVAFKIAHLFDSTVDAVFAYEGEAAAEPALQGVPPAPEPQEDVDL